MKAFFAKRIVSGGNGTIKVKIKSLPWETFNAL